MEEIQLDTGEVRLCYGRTPKNGPPLLFLHGVLRRRQDFDVLLPHFAHRWQVHALDFRGHGASGPHPRPAQRAPATRGEGRKDVRYRVVDYARDAVTLLGAVPGEPAVLYGHSLGAMVACAIAAAVPERVRALVLEDPPFETLGRDIADTPFHAQFLGMKAALEQSGSDVETLSTALADVRIPTASGEARLGDLRDATQLRFSASSLLKLDPKVFDPLLAGEWLEGFLVDPILQAIRCPALLLAADRDAGGMMPPNLVERVEHLIAGCTRVDLKGIGHNAHWGDPVGVLKLTAGFLVSLD